MDYADVIGSAIPGLLDPRSLRGFPSDGELARVARGVPRAVRGLGAWSVWALDALGAPAYGSGKNGAWTKADFERLVA